MGNRARSSSPQNEQTTPISLSSLHQVTIVHPFHPLRGEQVEVLRVFRRQAGLDLLVQRPDGTTMYVDMSLTDYAGSQDQVGDDNKTLPLLTWSALLEIARMIDRHQAKRGYA
jgi:hypothetical protein